jgi:hypothetical protein
MKSFARTLIAATLAASLGACLQNVPVGSLDGEGSDAADANRAADSAPDATAVDSGVVVDTGVVVDSGVIVDSGVVVDTGVMVDSGVVVDTGVVVDSGVSATPIAGGSRVALRGACTLSRACLNSSMVVVSELSSMSTPFSTTLDVYDRILTGAEMSTFYPYQRVPTGAIPVVPAMDGADAYRIPGAPAPSLRMGTQGVTGVVYQLAVGDPWRAGTPNEQLSYTVLARSRFTSTDNRYEIDARCPAGQALRTSYECTLTL